MLRILCLALCGLLPGPRADPGALLRLGMDILNHEVQSAMEESHILEKMAAEAGKKRPGVKPIKGITNMKVKDVQLPVITLNFVPEVGIFQCVSTGMTITGKSFMGGNMEIIIVLNITATDRLLQEEETGLPVFKSEGCEITLVSVKTNLPSPLQGPAHPGPSLFQLCPAIDAVLVYVNQKWMGSVKYALMSTPATMASHIQVDFSVSAGPGGGLGSLDPGGGILGGYAKGSSQLLLSAALLTAELALLQKSFNMDIQDQTVRTLLAPEATCLRPGRVLQVAEAYPKPKPVVTQIRINKPPKVTMKTGKSLLHFHGSLEIFTARRRGKPPVSLFLLETVSGRSPTGPQMMAVCSLPQEEELTAYITDYLQEAFVPVVNDVLRVGFPLPDLLAINYNLAELHMAENALVLDLKLD
uniref:BPI fold containing family B member 6 n=1 Tax=Spermophilus dauricus TaxID=99837 RepID=A0A8C9NXI4_SPEDA